MNIINKPVSEIHPYPNNARVIPQAAIDAVAESINRFSFRQPIVIDGAGVIVAGHTRYQAALKLGMTEVPCHVADDLTQEQIDSLRLIDNKSNELTDWDEKALAKEMKQLAAVDLSMFFPPKEEADPEKPQVQFSEMMQERHDYILLVFDSELDFLSAQTHFQIEPKMARRSCGRPGTVGIGRVVSGGAYLSRINGGN